MTQPSRPTLSHPYLDALAERVLVYDGAMGTNIQRHNPTAEDFGGKALEGCNDHLVLTRPDIIQSIHEQCRATADEYDAPGNYVAGANIAGFVKVADAMLDQGVV